MAYWLWGTKVYPTDTAGTLKLKMYILYQGEGGYSMPVYFGPPHTIWGLTAIVTFQLLRALLPTKLYNHKLLFQAAVRKP